MAGRAALRYFEDDNFMAGTRRKGEIMASHLQGLASKYSARGFSVRGKGMMQALDLGDGALAKAIARDCFEHGMLFGPCGVGGSVIKLITPLTIPDSDLEAGLAILGEAMDRQIEA